MSPTHRAARALALPLDGVRAPLLRDHHQLRGPAGAEHAGEDAGGPHRLDRRSSTATSRRPSPSRTAIGLLGAGRLLDKFGTRIGFAHRGHLWSVAAMMHAAATTAFTFGDRARAFWGSARRRISRPASRRWPSGFPSGSAAWPPASSTPAPISARVAHHSAGAAGWPRNAAGNRPSSSPAPSASSGSAAVAVALPPARGASQGLGGGTGADSQRSAGQGGIRAVAARISEEGNLGLRDSASSSPTRSGSSSCSGCPSTCRTRIICR